MSHNQQVVLSPVLLSPKLSVMEALPQEVVVKKMGALFSSQTIAMVSPREG